MYTHHIDMDLYIGDIVLGGGALQEYHGGSIQYTSGQYNVNKADELSILPGTLYHTAADPGSREE